MSLPTLVPEPQGAELRLTLALNRLGVHAPVLRLFRTVSRLGDGVFWYALLAALTLLGGYPGFPAAAHIGLTALFVAGLYRGMKHLIRRQRPYRRHAGIVARVRPLDEFSFPSGHTLHATCFTLMTMAYYPRLGWLLVPLSVLIAASRVILGVHYPSDVLAAAVIGTLIAFASLALF